MDRLAEDEVREVFRTFALARGEASLLDTWRHGVHPPLAPAVAALGLTFLPPTVAMRLPALLAGFGTILLVVALGRRTGRPEAGLVAGLLLASSPIWWAYSSAVSLDLPLAAFATLGAYATVGPRLNLPLALVAVLGAALTKRHGLAVVVMAVLLASLCSARPSRGLRLATLACVAGVAVASAWRYCTDGLDLFGSVFRLEEVLVASPAFVALVLAAALALVLAQRGVEPSARSALLPLVLFSLPLALTPFLGAHPAPRYLLPAVPIACVLAAAAIWLFGGSAPRVGVRWAASAALVVGSLVTQWADLQTGYWPRHRGHRDAVAWLAEHAAPGDVIFSPEGPFLEAAALQASVRTVPIVNVDRTTCAGLEARLMAQQNGAWVVLPLYRDLGWPLDFEAHAVAMGLELRALVRRDVVTPARPWSGVEVECLGPASGAPMLAILAAAGRPDLEDLHAFAAPVELALFAAGLPRGWRTNGVAASAGPAGGLALEFRPGADSARFYAGSLRHQAQLATVDWHHHRWLELWVRSEGDTLQGIDLFLGLRSETFARRLSALDSCAGDGGWRRLRLDLAGLPIEQTSRVHWFMLSAGGGGPVRLELRALRLLPQGAGAESGPGAADGESLGGAPAPPPRRNGIDGAPR